MKMSEEIHGLLPCFMASDMFIYINIYAKSEYLHSVLRNASKTANIRMCVFQVWQILHWHSYHYYVIFKL